MADEQLYKAYEILENSALNEEEVKLLWGIIMDQYSYGFSCGFEHASARLFENMNRELNSFKNSWGYSNEQTKLRMQKSLDEAINL